MRSFKHIVITTALLTTFCMCLSGCGKMTIEKLMENMNKSMADKTVTYSEVAMEMGGSYEMNVMGMDMSMDMLLNMDVEMWTSDNPVKTYMEGSMNIEMMDESIDSEIKSYMEEDGDLLVSYTYTGMDDSWTYSEEEFDAEEYQTMSSISTLPMEERFSDATLDEETIELNGREVYVLRLTCTGEDLDALMSELGGSMLGSSDYGDISFGSLSVPAVYYVDAETFLPVQMELEIEGMDKIVNQMLEEELGISSGTSDNNAKGLRGENDSSDSDDSSDYEDFLSEDMEFTIGDCYCHMVLSNLSFDPQEVPSVPDEVKESLTYDSLLEDVSLTLPDGSYVLKYDNYALKVSIPDDYSDMGSDEESLSFCDDDESAFIGYVLLTEDEVSDPGAEMKSLFDTSKPENILTDLGAAKIYCMEEEDYRFTMASIPMDDYTLFISVIEFEGNWPDAKSAIAEVVSWVSEVTYEDLK